VVFGLWIVGVSFVSPTPEDLVVEVDLASDTGGDLQLFADTGHGFREELSVRSSVVGDGAVHRHRLVLPSPRVLHGLRLDPLDRAAHLTLHRIQVFFGGRRFQFTGGSLVAWQPTHDLRKTQAGEAVQFTALQFTASGVDPQLLLQGPENPFTSPWQRFAAFPDGRHAALILLVIPLLLLALAGESNRLGVAGETLLALSTPLGLLIAHGLRSLQDWWLLDDPCLLVSTLRHGVWKHFFDPHVWRPLSGNVLMPWTPLSFGFDLHLFGASPQAFYLHQLLALSLLLVSLYALLRTTLTALGASLALSLFVVSAPAMAIAWRLMNRHYLEGTLLALFALTLYLQAVERKRFSIALLGAAFYLLASTAKEVFVPLVALLPLLPVGSLRLRLRYTVPFAMAGGLYALWRFYMLGIVNSVSGYAQSGSSSALDHLQNAPRLLGFTEPWQLLLIAVLLAVALGGMARRSPTHRLLSLGIVLVLVLPLIPVVDRLAPRHFFLPALALTTGLASAMRPWLTRRPLVVTAGALVLLLFGLQTLEHSPLWLHREQSARQYRSEGEFVLRAPPNQVLFTDLVNASYLGCMGELRLLLGLGDGPGFCGDACWCANSLPAADAKRYEAGLIVPFTPAPDPTCASPRALSVEMRYDAKSSRLFWRLGPYSSGEYQILLVHGEKPPRVSVPVPIGPRGSTPWTLNRPFRWMIEYRSSEGWETFSPILELSKPSDSLLWNRLDPKLEDLI
jgi:hypothetical protein